MQLTVASAAVQVSAQKSPVVVTAQILKSTRYDKDFVSRQVVVGLKNHDPIFDRLIKTKGGQVLDKIGVLSDSLVKVPSYS